PVRDARGCSGWYGEMGHLQIWYDRIDERAILDALSPSVRRGAQRIMDKARAKGNQRVLDKLTEKVGGEHRIVEELPLIIRESHTEAGISVTGLGESIPSSALIRSPGAYFLSGSAEGPRRMV